MWTLGLHGGMNTGVRFYGAMPKNENHDAAAVLCKNGVVVAAAEEERFTRIKHCTNFPLEAIRYCLESQGITLADVHRIALSSRHVQSFYEKAMGWFLATRSLIDAPHTYLEWTAQILQQQFGVDVRQPNRLVYAGHHQCHAYSAFALSGFEESLCMTIDGWGDNLTGTALSCTKDQMKVLSESSAYSLGVFYLFGTHWLGFDQHDEYKVMGLAPYGDRERFGSSLRKLYALEANGEAAIHVIRVAELQDEFRPAFRDPGAPLEQVHKDFAASLQAALEEMILHKIRYFVQQSGHDRLCLAGGVAQNCSANGAILRANIVKEVFVQPVAYDAGCALGAALWAYHDAGYELPRQRMQHLYLGSAIPDESSINAILAGWTRVVDVEPIADMSKTAAELLAQNAVIGWAQGRAEFGARALGNRSILADPRPAENKDRINAMVKKREGFRPFAPSVKVEALHEYFEVDDSVEELPFMVFVVGVRPPYRNQLGAITHVDGTARVQSVKRETNESYWRLIDEFHKLTGVPMVLNTSFNNNHEPIVNTVDDAVNCFLSTDIDYLIVDGFLVRKKTTKAQTVLAMVPHWNSRFEMVRGGQPKGWSLRDRYLGTTITTLSAQVCQVLDKALTEEISLGEALQRLGQAPTDALLDELVAMWQRRCFAFQGGTVVSNKVAL